MIRLLQITILCFLFSCKDEKAPDTDTAIAEPKSNDWIFMQRVYPAGQIEPASYKAVRAFRQQKEIALQARHNRSGWEYTGATNVGGRVTDVEILKSNPNVYYAGAASGGVFKSENAGGSWQPLFDSQLALSIGDIAIAPANEEIIYVGTGEPNAGGGSIAYDGNGVYRSDNGGDTWSHLGLEDIGSVGKIIVHPENPDIAFVAAMGHLFTSGPERGLYRTTDGGQQWEKVLFINDSTGIIDLAMHPTNPEIIYAAAWQRVRTAYRRAYGGPSSGIYKSQDGGETWQKLISGLPEAGGRIGITISPADPDILYAMYEDEFTGYLKGIYRSNNNGNTWTTRSLAGIIDPPYSYWFGKIIADPIDTNTVYLTSLDLYKSTNGGMIWNGILTNMHLDQHSVAFDPDNPAIILVGNDGGVYRSGDGVFDDAIHLNTLPITQFYTCEIDRSFPERLYGGAQDNGTVRTMTGSPNDWQNIYPGDGFRVLVDPIDNRYVYAEYQYGVFGRSTNGGSSFDIALDGIIPGDRFNWNTPAVLNPIDPSILYIGSQRLYKSENRAESWMAISPDLTENNSPEVSPYGTITTIAVSPVNDQIIYVGTDNSNVQVTADGGNTWTLISSSLPDRWVTSVAADPADQHTAYVTFSGYRFGESVSHIYKTEDLGASWTSISGDLPDMPVNDLIVTPSLRHLYIATDIGVLYSTDKGLHWELVSNGLPNVVITDITYHAADNILVAATYGRGMYKISPEAEITSVENAVGGNPLSIKAYPNPFVEQITVEFNVSNRQVYTLEMIDLDGKLIKTVYHGSLHIGLHSFNVDAGSVPAGIYFISVSGADRFCDSIMMLCRD
ncbi:MAG: T9SS type A sorting domain-containing protein [Saprospiraceae bacterium]|nr:T9SS type A sorting domain-containing protein [Candidatus Opimibacter skivensis]